MPPSALSRGPQPYLGRTSILRDFIDPPTGDEAVLRILVAEQEELYGQHGAGPSREDVLRQLHHLPAYVQLMEAMAGMGQSDIVMLPLALGIARQLQQDLKEDANPRPEAITQASRQATLMPSRYTPAQLVAECTGAKLRWDAIGIVLAVAGFCLTSLSPPILRQLLPNCSPRELGGLLDTTVDRSFACLDIVDSIGGGDGDMMTWQMYQNALLARVHLGDASHFTRRVLGRLCASIVHWGMHRSHDDDVASPGRADLVEHLRFQVVAMSHHLDKCLAAWLKRPPALETRYCTARPPQSTEDGSSIPETAPTAGLSSPPPIDATWAQAKLLHASLREEILAASQDSDVTTTSAQLGTLESKIASTWNALPERLRCAEDHWGDSRTPQVNCLLVINHLEHLYNKFLFHSLCRARDTARDQETASIASELLKSLLSIGLQRSKLRKVGLNLAHYVSFFGLPPSGLLAHELYQSHLRLDQTVQGLAKADVVKQLSSFASCLEWIIPEGGEKGNDPTCRGAIKSVNEVLDLVLLAKTPAPASEIMDDHVYTSSIYPGPVGGRRDSVTTTSLHEQPKGHLSADRDPKVAQKNGFASPQKPQEPSGGALKLDEAFLAMPETPSMTWSLGDWAKLSPLN